MPTNNDRLNIAASHVEDIEALKDGQRASFPGSSPLPKKTGWMMSSLLATKLFLIYNSGLRTLKKSDRWAVLSLLR